MRCFGLTVLAFLALAVPSAVRADLVHPPVGGPQGLLCRQGIGSAERGSGIPPHLLAAISRVESGRRDEATGVRQPWPWTINAEGEPHLFDTKEQAVAMVQKAVAFIKAQGPDKGYAAIDDKSGQFVQGDLYIAVVGLDGTLLAYGADGHRVGDNVMDLKDSDGKEVVKERVDLAKQEPSFWQSYKFMNPVTKTVEPKQMYCERLDETVVCGGVYQ